MPRLDPFARTLLHLTQGEHAFTMRELAGVIADERSIESAERHLYRVRSGTAVLSHVEAMKLAHYTSLAGDLRLADCFVPPTHQVCLRGEATANGSMLDELRDGVHALDSARQAHEAGSVLDLDDAIRLHDAVGARLRAERDRIK